MFRILDVSSLVLISIPANIDGSETYQVLSNINIHFSLANTIFGVISRDSTSAADCQDFFLMLLRFLSHLTSDIRSFSIRQAQLRELQVSNLVASPVHRGSLIIFFARYFVWSIVQQSTQV